MSTRTSFPGPAAPDLTGLRGDGLKVAIVAAQWHQEIMEALVDGATRGLAESGIDEPRVVRVPGTFELPVVCSRLASSMMFDALVALGVVIRGGTPHFDYVCQAATSGITQVCVNTGVPIGFGVLTCDDEQQAFDRAGLPESREDKGFEAAQAAIATHQAIRSIGC